MRNLWWTDNEPMMNWWGFIISSSSAHQQHIISSSCTALKSCLVPDHMKSHCIAAAARSHEKHWNVVSSLQIRWKTTALSHWLIKWKAITRYWTFCLTAWKVLRVANPNKKVKVDLSNSRMGFFPILWMWSRPKGGRPVKNTFYMLINQSSIFQE